MSVQKKKLFNKGRKTGIKGVQKERRRNVGGTSHSLTCPPPLPTFEKQNSDAKNSIGYCGLTPAIYLLLYGPVLRKRGVYPKIQKGLRIRQNKLQNKAGSKQSVLQYNSANSTFQGKRKMVRVSEQILQKGIMFSHSHTINNHFSSFRFFLVLFCFLKF